MLRRSSEIRIYYVGRGGGGAHLAEGESAPRLSLRLLVYQRDILIWGVGFRI